MGKKVLNNSRRIKTSHKRSLINRKVVNNHVDRNLANINKFIDAQLAKPQDEDHAPKIEAESMSFDELKKLLTGPSEKKRMAKLSVEDTSYLQGLLKKWGTNYERMAKDVKLNRMQWTAHQIEKKHQTYKVLVENVQES